MFFAILLGIFANKRVRTSRTFFSDTRVESGHDKKALFKEF